MFHLRSCGSGTSGPKFHMKDLGLIDLVEGGGHDDDDHHDDDDDADDHVTDV